MIVIVLIAAIAFAVLWAAAAAGGRADREAGDE